MYKQCAGKTLFMVPYTRAWYMPVRMRVRTYVVI